MFHCYDSDADRHGDYYSSDGELDEIDNYYHRDKVKYIHKDISTEAEHIVCNGNDPCTYCIEAVMKDDYCSCCDTPSVTKHISTNGRIISNNYIHTCYNCLHTAHWTCHAGESLMDPADVMELSSIRCIKCKSMIENNSIFEKDGPRISYLPYDKKFTKHTPLIEDLNSTIEHCNNMDCGYFKNLKFRKFLDHIVQNIRAYDEFKNDELESTLMYKIIDFEEVLGKKDVYKYIYKIF
jgi:hypothetical protein